MRTLDSDNDEDLRVESASLTKNGGGGRHVVLLFVDRDFGDKNNDITML